MNYKELEQEVKRLEEQIKDLKVKLEGKVEKKAYEVEVPEDIENYYNSNQCGDMVLVGSISYEWDYVRLYQRGLAFKTEEEARQYDKERILLFKMNKWAEEQNEGWTVNWNDFEEKQYYVVYDFEDKRFYVRYEHYSETFTKLPYFKSEAIAEQFIEEFGDEIKEVLC